MKCPTCGYENPEGQKFCGDCGAALPESRTTPVKPAFTPSTQTWIRSNWKGLVSVFIIVVVVLATVGLVYSQPWSKLKIIVMNNNVSPFHVAVYLDGKQWVITSMAANEQSVVGVWNVRAGSHSVGIERDYTQLDGSIDVLSMVQVGPLSTKNLYIDLWG